MKKLLLITILFLFSCQQTKNWYEKTPQIEGSQIIETWIQWVENPNKLVLDLSPILIKYPQKTIIKGKTIYFKLSDAQKYQNKRADEMMKFNRQIWNFITDKPIRKGIKVIKNNPTGFYYSFLDLSKNIIYGIMLTAPLAILPSSESMPLENCTKLSVFETTDIIRTYAIDDRTIFLETGNAKYGFRHILRNHTPKSYLRAEMKAVRAGKTLFLKSDKAYIKSLLNKFCQSDEVYFLENESKHQYDVYSAKIESSCGIMRKYKLVVNKQTNSIVSFYPINRINIRYIYSERYKNYIKIIYHKKI